MTIQHARPFSRRRFLGGLTLAGTAGLLGLPPKTVVAEPPPETTWLRVAQGPAICSEAPTQVAEELLRAEGFSDVQYVWAPGAAGFQKTAAGEIDLGLQTTLTGVRQ